MKLLLDTHTFLWFVNDSPQLSIQAKDLIESDADVLLSVVSLWEIAIKTSIGKLTLPDIYDKFIPQQVALNEFELLAIDITHLSMVATLPFHHRDPFDRLLIAQAMVENVPIISIDSAFSPYSVTQIW
jgi:PIN domain nuclease of toxin-antitoxin system